MIDVDKLFSSFALGGKITEEHAKQIKEILQEAFKDYQKKLIESLDKLEDGNHGGSKLIQIEQVKSLIENSLNPKEIAYAERAAEAAGKPYSQLSDGAKKSFERSKKLGGMLDRYFGRE
jgi:hypothetical protein